MCMETVIYFCEVCCCDRSLTVRFNADLFNYHITRFIQLLFIFSLKHSMAVFNVVSILSRQ
jgi:hypothetical protein